MASLDLTVKTVVEGSRHLKGLEKDLGAVEKKQSKVGKGFSNLGSSISSFINPTALAVGGVAALAGGLAIAAKAALDEEKGIAQLTAALKANDPAAASHIDQIEETIKEREKLAFADDEQRESLASLVSVTKDSEKALDLQRQAMDLARLKGIDLATASSIIGKVYSGNIGILGRYGIKLEEGATSTEALAEIQSRAAGQAEAYADTTAGSIESLEIVFGDLIEDIGAGLLPILKELAVFARDVVVPALGAVGDAAGIFGGIIDAINPMGAAVNNLSDDIRDTQERTKKNLKLAGEHWEDYSDIVSMSVDGIREGAEEIAQIPIDEIEAKWDEVRAAAFETTVQHSLGLLDSQDKVKTSMEVLARLQAEEMTEAAKVQFLLGQLNSDRLAAGLADGRPGVKAQAEANKAAIIAELASLGVDAYNAGANITSSIAAGLRAQWAMNQLFESTRVVADNIRRPLFIASEPEDHSSPLYGITKVGGNLVETLADGITSSLGQMTAATYDLAGAMNPGAGSAGSEVHYHLSVDGQAGPIDEKAMIRMLERMAFASGGFGERVLLGRS